MTRSTLQVTANRLEVLSNGNWLLPIWQESPPDIGISSVLIGRYATSPCTHRHPTLCGPWPMCLQKSATMCGRTRRPYHGQHLHLCVIELLTGPTAAQATGGCGRLKGT